MTSQVHAIRGFLFKLIMLLTAVYNLEQHFLAACDVYFTNEFCDVI